MADGDVCYYACNSSSKISDINEENLNSKFHSCNLCEEKFSNDCDLQMHCQLHAGNNEFNCLLCKQKFFSLRELKIHDLQHSLSEANEDAGSLLELDIFKDSFVCEFCDETFHMEAELMTHCTVHYAGTIEKTFNKCIIENNIPSDNFEPKIERCDVSEKDVKNDGNEKHMKEIFSDFYSISSKQFDDKHICKICFKEFSTKCNLKRHYNIHLDKRPYSCTICKKTFDQLGILKKHFLMHQKSKNLGFTCNFCDKEFLNKDLFDQHVSVHHDSRKKHKCFVCKKAFKNKFALIQHEIIHRGKKNFACDKCNKKFGFKSDLTRHLWNHLGLRPFVCDVCGKTFTRNTHLKRHQSIHTAIKNIFCKNCDKKYGNQFQLNGDTWNHLNLKSSACNICGKALTTKSVIEHNSIKQDETNCTINPVIHYVSENSEINIKQECLSEIQEQQVCVPETTEVCYVCQKKFPTRITLNKHFRQVHKGLKRNQCHLCLIQFAQHYELMHHLSSCTEKNDFKCSICNKQFKSMLKLKQHHTTKHNKTKPYECGDCKKKFANRNTLRSHMMCHKKLDNFKCELCFKEFSEKRLFKLHCSHFHDPKKKYVCDVCDRRFNHQYYLTRHMNVHTGKKDFQCLHCNKRYAVKSDLERHNWKHLGFKPFSCNLCGKTFTRKINIKRHIVSHDEVKLPKWMFENQ